MSHHALLLELEVPDGARHAEAAVDDGAADAVADEHGGAGPLDPLPLLRVGGAVVPGEPTRLAVAVEDSPAVAAMANVHHVVVLN